MIRATLAISTVWLAASMALRARPTTTAQSEFWSMLGAFGDDFFGDDD